MNCHGVLAFKMATSQLILEHGLFFRNTNRKVRSMYNFDLGCVWYNGIFFTNQTRTIREKPKQKGHFFLLMIFFKLSKLTYF